MEIKYRYILYISSIFLLIGCQPQGQIEIGYQPPIIPVRIAINSRGEISAGFSSELVTPAGIFDIGGGVSVNTIRTNYVNNVLIVRVDNQATVYELEEGKEFNIIFDDSNTLYKKVSLKYESNGDILLELESVKVGTNSSAPTSQSSTSSSNNYWCDDLNLVKLKVGDGAKIVWLKVNLRSSPKVTDDFNANVVVQLEEGTSLTIIDGPECAHNGTWWKVRTEFGDIGWSREYTESNGYLIQR